MSSGAILGEFFLIICAAWLIPAGFYAAYRIARGTRGKENGQNGQ